MTIFMLDTQEYIYIFFYIYICLLSAYVSQYSLSHFTVYISCQIYIDSIKTHKGRRQEAIGLFEASPLG